MVATAPVKRGDLFWIQPGANPLLVDGYEFTETFDPNTNERVDYIKVPFF